MKNITIYGTDLKKATLISAVANLASHGQVCTSSGEFEKIGEETPVVVYKGKVPYGAIICKTHGSSLCALVNTVDGEVEIAADEGITQDEVEQFYDVIVGLARPMERDMVLRWILEGMKARAGQLINH